MKRFAVSLLCLLAVLMPSTGRAGTQTVVTTRAYAVPIHYSNSALKSDGYAAGVYAYIGHGLHHSFEAAADHSQINYKTGPDLKQWDYTGVYTYYRNAWKYRLGLHYIDSTDDWSNGAMTFFAGTEYFAYTHWNMGIDGYFTNYDNQAPHLNVTQVSPQIGWYLMKKRNTGIYAQVYGHYIRLSKDTDLGLDHRDYLSTEGDLTCYYNQFSIKGFGWTGKQVFAVRNGGFVVYNLAEEHTGGYGGSVSYDFQNGLHLSLASAVEQFKDIGAGNHASMVTYTMALGGRF